MTYEEAERRLSEFFPRASVRLRLGERGFSDLLPGFQRRCLAFMESEELSSLRAAKSRACGALGEARKARIVIGRRLRRARESGNDDKVQFLRAARETAGKSFQSASRKKRATLRAGLEAEQEITRFPERRAA